MSQRLLLIFQALQAGNRDRLLQMQVARMDEAAIAAWTADAEAILKIQAGKQQQRSQRRQASPIESWRVGN